MRITVPVDRRLILFAVSLAVLLIIGYPFYQELVRMTAEKQAQSQFEKRVEQLESDDSSGTLPARQQLSDTALDAMDSLSMGTGNVPPTAPDFKLPALGGDTHSLRGHRGQFIFINFWATWCRACRQEMPSMQRIWTKYGERSDFTMLAVNVQEQKPAVKKFVTTYNLTFPVLMDVDGRVADQFHVTGIPESVIITPRGEIIGKAIGYRLWDSPEALTLFSELFAMETPGR